MSGSVQPNQIAHVGVTTDDQQNAILRRAQGEFVRGVSAARHWIVDQVDNNDGNNNRVEAADDDDTGISTSGADTTPTTTTPTPHYPVQSGRYHLIVAYNCPWCHRVLLGRAIAGLKDVLSVDVVFPNRSNDDEPLGPNLWKFAPNGAMVSNRFVSFPTSCTADTVFGGQIYVKTIYEMAGLIQEKSVPLLIDKQTMTVVNNESAEILRMFGTVFRPLAEPSFSHINLYPQDKAQEILDLNEWIYTDIANGAYKAGFSSNQDVYEAAYHKFFTALDRLNDDILADRTFLLGDHVTEVDIRLFPPLYRFDPVYHLRFKLNHKYLWQYDNIWRWMSTMMHLPGMEDVSNLEYLNHCKQGYFGRTGNGTIPVGPPGYPDCYRNPNWNPTNSH